MRYYSKTPGRPHGEKPINKVVGKNIKYYFERSNMTITDFSHAIGNGANTVRIKQMFNGEVTCYLEKLQLIAYVLDCKTIDLVKPN